MRIKNYRSVAACDVRLGSLTFLVGPNGSGKSNFIDALRLVADSLRTSLDHALRDRGGISEVRRRSTGHPRNFSIRLDFASANTAGHYAFEIGSREGGSYAVTKEECRVEYVDMETPSCWYRVERGRVVDSSEKTLPAVSEDRLLLVALSGNPLYRPIYDGLSEMGFYNLNPDAVRELQSPDAGELLLRDGANVASVLGRLEHRFPKAKERIESYLATVVPGIVSVARVNLGPKETLEFRQNVQGGGHSWRFSAASMSDGTLRALGVLVALFQVPATTDNLPLIAIEEPEVALHPAAADVLRDALLEASETRQVLASSHSPELLDSSDIGDDQIIAVTAEEGTTRLARPDRAGIAALRDHLYTPGELLRINQLLPDEGESDPESSQMRLFEGAS
ncbi:AAA family ATPase [Nocardia beijingensis]|uniref:AAA family ATPase n=1 Tax=Nocardia beijingensis TaxID=95162 RepID=UPI001C3F89D9|nr:AAA family ATPase [Nocardia beijingensis]